MEPLFVESKIELKKRLRLSGVPDIQDADIQIDEAISVIRVHLMTSLTPTAAIALAAVPLDRNPTDTAGQVRLAAAVVETKWVMWELLCVMPVRFADGTSELQSWAEEGIWRDKDADLLAQLKDKLFNDIQLLLDLINGGGAVPSSVQVAVIGPDFASCPPPRPGDSAQVAWDEVLSDTSC